MKEAFSLSNLPETIPVFPLSRALLLPRARLPLNIFEPRYLTMVDDALKTDHRLIGMIQPMEVPKGEGSPHLHHIGCAGRVTSFTETDDGRYMITLHGACRFRLIAQNTGFTPYVRADVDWQSFERDLGKAEVDDTFNRPRFLKLLSKYFQATGLSTDWDSLREASEEMLVNTLSILLPFEPEEKQALLETPSLSTRRETLVTLMEFTLRSGGTEDGRLQ